MLGKGGKEHEHGGDVHDVGKGGQEQHDEHGGYKWVDGGWSQAADDGDGWSQAAGDGDDRWHDTGKGGKEQHEHGGYRWHDVGKGGKEQHEHGGTGCTGGTGWSGDDWGQQWPNSGDGTWMGDQYDGGCWWMQRGSYIGR